MKIIIVIFALAMCSCSASKINSKCDMDSVMVHSLRYQNTGVVESAIFNCLNNQLTYDTPVGEDVILELERLKKDGKTETIRKKAEITLDYLKLIHPFFKEQILSDKTN